MEAITAAIARFKAIQIGEGRFRTLYGMYDLKIIHEERLVFAGVPLSIGVPCTLGSDVV